MNLKSLFFTDAEGTSETPNVEQPVQPVQQPINKFPTAETTTPAFTFPQATQQATPMFVPNVSVAQEHLEKTLELYQQGFDSLNQPGYDFYEYYQAVVSAGVDNPQIYQMAFTMASAMDKTITKDKLVQQSDFYISEITKVHTNYVEKGNVKKQELIQQKSHENESLVGELDLMRQQLEALKTQIADRENKLQAIDGKYGPKLVEIEGKLAANDLAKETMVNSIEKVKQGIINNLK